MPAVTENCPNGYKYTFYASTYTLPGIIRRSERLTTTIEEYVEMVVQAVCNVTGLKRNQVISKIRFRDYVMARNVVCYYTRKHTKASLKQIGNALGLHHSTIIHSLREMEKFMGMGDDYAHKLVRLTGDELHRLNMLKARESNLVASA